MSILAARDLTVAYGKTLAVRRVGFAVGEGECLGLIGTNGAGKSSTLLGIMGLVPLAQGEVSFAGRDLAGVATEERVRMGLAMVPEGRRIFSGLTVEENLLLGMAPLAKERRRNEGRQLLDGVYALFPRLAPLKGRLGGALSGGEAQMLAVGRALMSAPRLLLLDEPTLGLAPSVVEALAEGLMALKKSGLTMLVVEQKLPIVLALAERVLVMRAGEVKAEMDPEAIRSADPRDLYFPHGGERQ